MNNKAQTPEIALTELSESFGLFGDWEDRYRYLIDLGKRIPPMDSVLKTEETLVRGCTSKVWMVAGWQDDRLKFQADSDAQIIKGLIYILDLAYQNRSRAEIESLDINKTFEDLGLDRHLSPNRRNGFFSMVERIRSFA
ncbi:MAG: fe-S metabolism associated domain protein [Micavibrio sp.]|nr:fe-S metabolism associated domain protein [Micavibrio sp.]